jgi:hypothetical protein
LTDTAFRRFNPAEAEEGFKYMGAALGYLNTAGFNPAEAEEGFK